LTQESESRLTQKQRIITIKLKALNPANLIAIFLSQNADQIQPNHWEVIYIDEKHTTQNYGKLM
jgi:hypothetical protein